VLWLPRGVYLDETDGHVDNLACFVEPGRVLLTWEDDPSDPQHERSVEARRVLERSTDARGRTLEVDLVPAPSRPAMTDEEASGIDRQPGAKPRRGGDPLAASYVNYYLGNEVVVHPRLDPDHDDEAAELLGRLFPDRRIVGIDAREIILGGGGNIHCITQQVPRLAPPVDR
jgi:agmatine deiminase